MFDATLFVHSWFRWVVLLTTISLMVKFIRSWIKKEIWDPSDNSYLKGYAQIYYTQIAIGLTLYFGLSPIPKAVISDPSLLKNPYYFFFSMKHPLSMLIGVGVFHMGKAFSKKRVPSVRYKYLSLTMMVILLIICSAIPWPLLSYGRDLFRWS